MTPGMILGRLESLAIATFNDLPGRCLIVCPAVYPLGAKFYYMVVNGAYLLLLDPLLFYSFKAPSLIIPSLAKTLPNLSIRDASNF